VHHMIRKLRDQASEMYLKQADSDGKPTHSTGNRTICNQRVDPGTDAGNCLQGYAVAQSRANVVSSKFSSTPSPVMLSQLTNLRSPSRIMLSTLTGESDTILKILPNSYYLLWHLHALLAEFS